MFLLIQCILIPRSPQDVPRSPKIAPRGPKMAQDGPKRALAGGLIQIDGRKRVEKGEKGGACLADHGPWGASRALNYF